MGSPPLAFLIGFFCNSQSTFFFPSPWSQYTFFENPWYTEHWANSYTWIKGGTEHNSSPKEFITWWEGKKSIHLQESQMVAWGLDVIPNLAKSVSFTVFLWAVLWFHYYVCHPSIIMDSTFFRSQGCPRFDDKLIVTLILSFCAMKSIFRMTNSLETKLPRSIYVFFYSVFLINIFILIGG